MLIAGDPSKYERDVLIPFRQRYTSATRLVLSAVDAQDTEGNDNASTVDPAAICVEVQFSGPQPCLGPGSLPCALLAGTSVRAHPVQLERGRKKKLRRTGSSMVVEEGKGLLLHATRNLPRRMTLDVVLRVRLTRNNRTLRYVSCRPG